MNIEKILPILNKKDQKNENTYKILYISQMYLLQIENMEIHKAIEKSIYDYKCSLN